MRKILYYLCITLAIASCTKDSDVTPHGDNALSITSNIVTRVTNSQWDKNDEIGVYMTSADFGDLGANVLYSTSSGNGDFTSTTPLYYPSSGVVDIFAYYPWVDGVNLTAYPINSEDQVDLLSVTKEGVISSSSALELTFKHLLSKVSLTIEAGDGLTTDDLAALEVKLSGISTTADFNITDMGATTTNTGGDLELTTAADGTSSSAIVIPQELGDVTLYFTTDAYGTYLAEIQTAKFDVGNEYNYKATLNRDGVVLSEANIDPWDEDAESSTADIVDIAYISAENKYYINSAAGFAAFRDLVNGVENTTATSYNVTFSTDPQLEIDGVLTRDIDLEDVEWTPIGNYNSNTDLKYSGIFDGGGHIISGLYINLNSGSNYQGLFGYTCADAEISNLGVSGSVSGSNYVGGVVGSNYGTLTNCYNTGDVDGEVEVGGVVGWNSGTLTNCYNTGDVDGEYNVGGVVGTNASGTLTNCYNTGDVSEGDTCVGGVVGFNYGTLTNCYNTAVVSGNSYVGGVVGENYGTLTNCYNTGDVDGEMEVGGVVGWNSGTLTNCYNTASVSADWSVGGVVGDNMDTLTNCYWDSEESDVDVGVGSSDDTTQKMTTEAMQAASFVTTLNNNAYNYNAENPTEPQACAWVAVDSDYPTLDFDSVPQYIPDIVYNDGTYEIYSANGLWAFADLVNGNSNSSGAFTDGSGFATFGNTNTSINGKLMCDIDLSTICRKVDGTTTNDVSWIAIGGWNRGFNGIFDGAGYIVSGLYHNISDNNQGFFGYVETQATIKNLGVEGSVTGNSDVGAIAGFNYGTVTNCYSSCMVTGSSWAGGIVGFNGGTVSCCYSRATVSATSFVGGVVGQTNNSNITNCYYDTGVAGNIGALSGSDSGTNYCGLTTEQMKGDAETEGTLLYYLTNENYGNSDVWQADTENINDGYPILNFDGVPIYDE